jgi:hypothetical protein
MTNEGDKNAAEVEGRKRMTFDGVGHDDWPCLTMYHGRLDTGNNEDLPARKVHERVWDYMSSVAG